MVHINFIKDFEKATGLKLRACENGTYREISGKSYKTILKSLKEYNSNNHDITASAVNDYMRDATFVSFIRRATYVYN